MVEYIGGPRSRDALEELLVREGFRPTAYSLWGAHRDNAIVIDHRGATWLVFYSERGGEYQVREHATEAEACDDALNRLWNEPSYRTTT